MTTKEKRLCSKRVYSGGGSHLCTRSGVVEHEGKWWCGQHDPEEVKRRRDERSRAWKENFFAGQAASEAKKTRTRLVRQRSREAIEALRFLAIFRYPADHPQVISAKKLIESIDAEHILDDLQED